MCYGFGWKRTSLACAVLAINCLLCCAEERLLRLLTVVPFPSNQSSDGWTQGLETIPAGLLALKHINETQNVLAGYTLDVLVMEGEGCGKSVIVKDVYSLFEAGIVLGKELNVVGVAGLLCSTPTGVVSKVAGKEGVDLIQVSSATSIALQNATLYPRLYRVSSTRTVGDAIADFMKAAMWKQVSTIQDEEGLYFQSTAKLIIDTFRSRPDFKVINVATITADESAISRVLDEATVDKILVVIATEAECSSLMCAAYRRGRIWPGYVYILLDRSVDDFKPTENCDSATMVKAIEGAFTVNPRIKANDDALLVSGMTYAEYWEEYLQELQDFSEMRPETLDLRGTPYANAVYDEVWAFALALNNSLAELTSRNMSLLNYSWGQGDVSDVIEGELRKVSFQGAGGKVSFGDKREPAGSFEIHQIINGKTIFVAQYDEELNLSVNYSLKQLPSDSINRVYECLPSWLVAVVLLMCVMALSFTVFNSIMFISLRKKPDVKASSPYLSLLMSLGCGLSITSVTIYVSTYANVEISLPYFNVLCNAEAWLTAIGLNLILTTLFVRLLRIYRLFQPNNLKKLSKIWRDKFLMLGALVLSSVSVIILSVWTIADRLEMQSNEIYIGDTFPPYFETSVTCLCQYWAMWLSLLYGYDTMLLFGIVFMAVKTKRIKLRNFKDTKKVIVFVYLLIATLAMVLALWGIFQVLRLTLWAHFVFTMGTVSVSITCQLILHAPKTTPHICRCVKKLPKYNAVENSTNDDNGFKTAYTRLSIYLTQTQSEYQLPIKGTQTT